MESDFNTAVPVAAKGRGHRRPPGSVWGLTILCSVTREVPAQGAELCPY